jgi:hypothetical protein
MKNEYAKQASLYLANLLRSNKITLIRAGQIAGQISSNINLLDTYEHYSKFLQSLSREFPELADLKVKIDSSSQNLRRKELEQKVQQFAVKIMASDSKQAHAIIEEVMREGITQQKLMEKFPNFGEFVKTNG